MFDYDSKVLYINGKDNDGKVNVLQLSVGVEYALHCLLFMAGLPAGRTAGIKDLATYQGVSATYLSKVFTKLTNGQIKPFSARNMTKEEKRNYRNRGN